MQVHELKTICFSQLVVVHFSLGRLWAYRTPPFVSKCMHIFNLFLHNKEKINIHASKENDVFFRDRALARFSLRRKQLQT